MRFLNSSISNKCIAGFGLLVGVTLIAGAVSVWSAAQVADRGLEVGQRLAPLGDAAMEIKLSAAQAHLLFEEIMSGDEGESIDEVWRLLDDSRFYAGAILEGGANDEGVFAPTESPAVRAKIKLVQKDIDRFVELGRERYAALTGGGEAAAGSSADEAFDQTYERLVATADEAEELIHDDMDAGIAALRAAETVALVSPLAATATILLLAMFGYRLTQRLIASRLRELVETMRRLGEGDLSVQPPRWRSEDEVGELKASVTAFREALIERAELERASAEAKAKTEAHNRDALALNKGLSELIDSANQGDLSRRVTAEYADPALNGLAERVNGLVATVADAVAETNRVLSALARADLSQKIDRDFHGAFGELRDGANATVDQLSKMIADIRSAAATAQGGSQQIEQGSRDLSQRAESQASALEETAATMEELADSVRGTAGSADTADKMAGEATQKALRGKEVVDQAVDAMGRIEQSSEKISDIISVIESIAFQTNLLALNAAVEAARAGDAGKGFAVVASEVRTLAQRSSEAARDIKELIQNSSAGVAQGVGMVRATGESLDEIREAIERVAQSIAEVADATTQQLNGVSEINANVGQLDQMTQQNAALAQESAATAQSLASEISTMNRLVGAFALSAKERRAATADAERGADKRWSAVAAKAPAPARSEGKAAKPAPQPLVAVAGADWGEF